MNDVFDIARYLINKSFEKGHPISNLKLQKLLYYVQGVFLVAYDSPCFSQPIEAWGFGPVVSSVYHEYKEFGANNIPRIEEYFTSYFDDNSKITMGFKPYDEGCLDTKVKEIADIVIDTFLTTSATDLVSITHQQDPWKNIYSTSRKNIVISNESIKNYFSKIVSVSE